MSEQIYSYEGLDPKYIAKAKKELNENPDQIRAHIESFRRWVKSMPHIQCPTDNKFLLRFLRVAKFDHENAEQRLDNYCTLRGSPKEYASKWYKSYPPVDSPFVDEILKLVVQIPLGLNDEGEQVVLARVGSYDIEKYPLDKIYPVLLMGLDVLLDSELAQINGVIYIMDLTGFNQKHMRTWSDQKLAKAGMKIWQDCCPSRFKGQLFYKEPAIFDVIYKMMEFWINPRMRERIHRCKDDLGKLSRLIPGGKKILPKEYGGDNGTIQECHERWVAKFKAYYKNGNPLENISIDENKRPSTTFHFMKQYQDYPNDIFGTQGTYRKIED